MQAKMINRSGMENLWPPGLQNREKKQTNKQDKKKARFIAKAKLL